LLPFWRGWLIIPGKGWIFEGRSALSERNKIPEFHKTNRIKPMPLLSAKLIEFNHALQRTAVRVLVSIHDQRPPSLSWVVRRLHTL